MPGRPRLLAAAPLAAAPLAAALLLAAACAPDDAPRAFQGYRLGETRARRARHGPPTEEASTPGVPAMRWARWPCCELRLTHAGLVVTVSYLDRRLTAPRPPGAAATLRDGRALVQ